MHICGLTPTAQIAGKPFRFELRPRDALAWIAVGQCDELQRKHLLANSPEILVWCMSRCTDGATFGIQDMVQALQQVRQDSTPATHRSFDVGAKKKYLKALRQCGHDSDLDDSVESNLTHLIARSCELGDSVVNDWFQLVSLPQGFWREIASEVLADSRPIEIMVPLNPVVEESDFQARLHQEKMASMKQLAYGASHEINNPLANIASRAQTLLMDETDPDRRLKLAKINQQAFRAHEMIADMMLFAHPPKPDFTLTDPVVVVQEVISEMQPVAEQQNTVIKMRTGQSKSGSLDRTQLAVAVKAIVVNSLESLQQSGTIDVQLESHDGSLNDHWLEITISDDGPGIAQDSMNHIFDPFFSGREAGRGLGFGLSKAWRIAELHGGEISAENPAHGGARFCLRIPYRDVA